MEATTARLFALPLALALASCATTPVSDGEAQLAPVERVIAKHLLLQRQGTYPVVLKRDASLMGSACSHRVYVNGAPTVDLRQGERTVLFLPAGDHVFSSQPNGICTGKMSEVAASLRPGQRLALRIGAGPNGDWAINVTGF